MLVNVKFSGKPRIKRLSAMKRTCYYTYTL